VIVVDTGVLYALADTSDANHKACRSWLGRTREQLLVPSLVITEAAYLIGSRGGTERLIKDSLDTARQLGNVVGAVLPVSLQ
jgi:uncharacterized protein